MKTGGSIGKWDRYIKAGDADPAFSAEQTSTGNIQEWLKNATVLLQIDNDGNIIPETTDSLTIGEAGAVFAELHVTTVVFGGAVTGDISFLDDYGTIYGTGSDTKISYNGTDLIINPMVVGSGAVVFGKGEGGATLATGATLRPPSIIAGGAGNIAGADLTITPGAGTGTGDVGQIIFQTYQVAAAGDNLQTTLETIFTLDEDLATFSKAVNVIDDIALTFGGVVSLIWETADANANALYLVFPDGGATDIPAFMVGTAGLLNTDLTLLDGKTFAISGIVDNDEDSWFGMTFSADDTPQIQVGGSATAIGFNAPLTIGTIDIDDDSGVVTLVDMGVTADPADGTEESIGFAVDGNVMLKLYTEADSAGAVDTFQIQTMGDIIVGGYYQQFTEMTAPGAGAANTARIYALEGAGDALTDLCAVFQDGTVDVFAQESTEPDSPIFQFGDSTPLSLTLRKPDRKTVQFVATFPDGRDFVMREIRYPEARWN